MPTEISKGEALIKRLDQIREGLDMIAKLESKPDLVVTLVGSHSGAKRLREVMRSNTLIHNLVISMVNARNARLSEETVRKVITDFLDVLFDLSKPYRETEVVKDEASSEDPSAQA